MSDDILRVRKIKVSMITDKYGRPVHVYDEDITRKRYRSLIENIVYPKIEIYYACKANYVFLWVQSPTL